MSRARLILNIRYFYIVRAGEQVDGKHIIVVSRLYLPR